MFKKVIGQSHIEPTRPVSPSEAPRPEPVAVPAPVSHGPQAVPARSNPVATRNILSSDVEIKGTVKFSNDLVVDGKIEGEVFSDGNLIVGENARIKAEVKTATLVVYGKVHGNLTATERIDLKASAEVVGDIRTKTLSIEAGAIFVGKSIVGTPTQQAAASPAPAQGQAARPQPSGTPAQQGQPARPPQGGAPAQPNQGQQQARPQGQQAQGQGPAKELTPELPKQGTLPVTNR